MAERSHSPGGKGVAPIRVVLIEPRPILALAVREVLDENADFDVVAHVETVVDAAPFLADAPDVIVVDLDVREPVAEATRRLQHAVPSSALVVIGGEDDDASIVSAVGIGAVARLADTAAPDELVATIRRVVEGEDPIKEELAGRPDLIERVVDGVRQSIRAAAGPRLTPRELDVLRAAASSTNKEIAERFGLSEQTVKNHLTSIFHKLGVPNRTRAILYASRQGWLDLADAEIAHRSETAEPD